jgi:O-antigen/teichoic acid export membrane protein
MRHRWHAEIAALAPKLVGTLGASGVAAVLGLVSGTVAARVLGPSGRGDLAQLLLWPQLVITLGNLGVELGAVYLSGDRTRRRDVPATVLGIALAQSLVLMPVYLVLVPFVFAGTGIVREAMWMTPLIPMYLVGAVMIDCLAGRLRFGAFNAVRLALPVLYCGGMIAVAEFADLSPSRAALLYLAAHGAGDALAVLLVWRESGLGKFDRGIARDVLHYGVRSHFGRITPQSVSVDTAIIALMLSSHEVGLYAAAGAFLAAPSLVASSIGMVVFPQVSASHQAGERQHLQATFALHVCAVTALALLLFAFAGPIVTLLFGGQYADAVPALRFLALGSIAVSIRAFPIEVLRGVGRPGLTSIAEAANWATFLVAIPIGAATGGLIGTAAAVAGAGFASLGVLVVLIWRSGAMEAVRPPALRVEAAEAAL